MLSSASRSDQWSESTGGSGRSRCARSSSSEGVLFVDVGPLSKLLGSEISNWIVTAALKKLLHVLWQFTHGGIDSWPHLRSGSQTYMLR